MTNTTGTLKANVLNLALSLDKTDTAIHGIIPYLLTVAQNSLFEGKNTRPLERKITPNHNA